MHKNTFLLFIISFFLIACGDDQTQQGPGGFGGPAEVTVSKPLKKKIIEWDEYTGRFQAVERVELRARVSGYLDEIKFKDGDIVQKDDVLFVIDQRPFKIELDRAKARFELAKKDLERSKALRKTRAVSQQDLDNRQQEFDVAKADLEQAELNMEFTEVRTPVTGRVSRNTVDVGNLVNGDTMSATALTTIVSLDPIHFYFEASEQELLKYIRLHQSGARPGSHENPNPVYVKLQDEKDFKHVGTMDFVDNEVDLGTGTIQGRAIFPNTKTVIYPGMFGRARVLGSGLYEALLVPDTAIGTDQSKKFVMVVDKEGNATRKFVELGGLRDSGLRIIKSGLTENDQVIIKGTQRARPGVPVKPKQGKIEEKTQDSLPKFEEEAVKNSGDVEPEVPPSEETKNTPDTPEVEKPAVESKSEGE